MKEDIECFDQLNLLYLSNHSSSGNTFFLSLLDGHPEIINFPGYVDLNFIFEKKFSFEDYLKVFHLRNKFFFDTSKMEIDDLNHQGLFYLGEECNQGIILNKELFEASYMEFSKKKKLTKKNILLALYYAYAKITNKNINQLRYIILYPYDHANTIQFIKNLGIGKIIIISRNLFNNYYSFKNKLKKKLSLRKEDEIKNLTSHSHYLYNSSKNIIPLLRANLDFCLIKIEDLHQKPEQLLKKLCNLLNISYLESLLSSTFLGKKYNGHTYNINNAKLIKFSGFNASYHNADYSLLLNKAENTQILFIGFFYLRSHGYIKKGDDIKKLIKNFLYIFYPNDYEKIFFRKKNSLKYIYKYIELRCKFIYVFLYQFNKLDQINKKILQIK